jgi:hypothetical protein
LLPSSHFHFSPELLLLQLSLRAQALLLKTLLPPSFKWIGEQPLRVGQSVPAMQIRVLLLH